MQQPFSVFIPARFGSTRFPAKVLADLAGKTMLQRVYEQALKSGAQSVVIATDDQRIKQVAEKFGAEVCLTSSKHLSGTSRIAEAAKILGMEEDAIIVNVQGDQPLIPPVLIKQAAEDLATHPEAKIATLATPIATKEDLFNPHITKVVLNNFHQALYFSRAPIPWERDNFASDQVSLNLAITHYRHIGVYAYRVGFLQEYINWQPSELENTEKLEQLRVLYCGAIIHVSLAQEAAPLDVDDEGDLLKVKELLAVK